MKSLTSPNQLSKLLLAGFKSIAKCELEFGSLNVLIGCNGAGKSNLISFFRMIQQMLEGNLQIFVNREGGPDSILHFGRKTTERLFIDLSFGVSGYQALLEATKDNRLMFAEESCWQEDISYPRVISRGHFESTAKQWQSMEVTQNIQNTPYLQPLDMTSIRQIFPSMQQWRVYHFHDTSDSAQVKQIHQINDNAYLRPDARNLAAFLYFLQKEHPREFAQIVKTVSLVAPFFGQFQLRPSPENKESIELEWFERGRDVPFKAHHLSDGTLRFICLATVFLQPALLQPQTILVDEPELGLHPYAIATVASLIRSVSKSKQVIISTQSVELLNEFDPEDVIVVDRANGRSEFRRLDHGGLTSWLEDYSLGELWKKNLLGGRPSQ